MRLLAVIFIAVAIIVSATGSALASIVLNEILADPAPGTAGDANNDGVTSSTQDEFVELLNFGDTPIDISGWFLGDLVKTRHVFSVDTILLPQTYLVVFGGGSPNLPDINWQLASSGALGLNNGGDTVSLFDQLGNLMNEVIYGSDGGKDQSLARYPEGSGTDFLLHSTIPEADGRLFSPGTPIDGGNGGGSKVPEPLTLLYVSAGLGLIRFIKREA